MVRIRCSPAVHGTAHGAVRAFAAIIIGDPGPAHKPMGHPGNQDTGRLGIGWTTVTWLITGGAGYIGAHVARAMAGAGENVVALDDLSAAVPARLPAEGPARPRLDAGRGTAEAGLRGVRRHWAPSSSAARKQVAGVGGAATPLLPGERGGLAPSWTRSREAASAGCCSPSSAAVYGNLDTDPITEDTPCAPVNPYGETKLAGEWLVRAAGRAHGISTVCLRYFNVAGAAAPELGGHRRVQHRCRWSSTGSPGTRPRAFSATTTRRRTACRPGLHPRRRPRGRPPRGGAAALRRGSQRRSDPEHRPRRGRLGARADLDHRGGHRRPPGARSGGPPPRRRAARGGLGGAGRGRCWAGGPGAGCGDGRGRRGRAGGCTTAADGASPSHGGRRPPRHRPRRPTLSAP